MGVYIDAGCANAPEWFTSLAVIGGLVIYVLIGALIFFIVKSFKDDLDWDYIALFIVAWPIIFVAVIGGAIVYYFARLIAMPIIGADKYDLKELEDKVEDKIETEIDHLKYDYKPLVVKKAKPSKKKAKKKAKK